MGNLNSNKKNISSSRVLAVDDVPENLELLTRILQREGFQVFQANNGAEALKLLQHQPVDLIISDILMPVLDGYEFCRRCQIDHRLRHIPFIFYTATYTDDKDRRFGLSLGASCFIIKPAKARDFLEIVKKTIKKIHTKTDHGEQTTQESPPAISEEQYIRQYNSRLVKKLEDKLIQLDQANQRLTKEIEKQTALKHHIEQLNLGLEDKIAARTRELVAANKKLKELDLLKSMFVASISHELRTPLNSILGFSGILLNGMSGDLNDEQSRQINIIKKNAAHLLDLINDIIDLGKIEAGAIDITRNTFNLSHLINDICQLFFGTLNDKGLRLNINAAESIIIYSDQRRVRQILINLISNAVKYTSQGTIDIQLQKTSDYIDIVITDTGMGIDDEGIKNLFQPFSKTRRVADKYIPGTGLGLYLSQRLAHLLSGEIIVRSQVGVGSCFTLRLPACRDD